MYEWNREDELNIQKILSVADDSTTEWIQKKTKELMTLMVYYKCAMMEIETKFNVLNEEFSLEYDRNPISSIKTRLKTPQSIRDKMQRKGIPATPDSIEETLNDIAGVRVICSFPEDVYMLAEALLRQDDIILIQKKDYIANPKPNGYRSLHIIVAIPIFLAHEKHLIKVEIQLRTIAMDFWASLEHQIRYKKDVDFTEKMAKELSECAQTSAALDNRMDNLRKSIAESEPKKYQPKEN
ncbi:MAG: GTP pyrophosphokinase family protein [Clostridia bacterium]|nr:GTP pyrophosphokinase family protein [Clostridia bacterium]